ncbi:MAG: RluA family pseudouridine synthase [Treponema sp.]|nr:RluA family pseudouridine synthase [Treponema sp.]
MRHYSCIAEDIKGGIRVDRYAAENLALMSRSQMKTRSFKVVCNGREVRLSRLVKDGDRLEFSWADAESPALLPEDLPLDIIYEDENVVVVNKAQGMIVHPGAGVFRGTLANAILFRQLRRRGLSGDGAHSGVPSGADQAGKAGSAGLPPGAEQKPRGTAEALRPGIVHRLDKDTSGVIIAAYDERTLAFLAEQFKTRKVKKCYAAIVQGTPQDKEGSIETFIGRDLRNRKLFAVSDRGGKPAFTRYKAIRSWNVKGTAYTLLLIRPATGRTHQIRVHMSFLGHPVLGDPLYGKADPLFQSLSLMLHSKSLTIRLPHAGGEVTFSTPLPGRFREFIRRFE